jgi:hypothetical protein
MSRRKQKNRKWWQKQGEKLTGPMSNNKDKVIDASVNGNVKSYPGSYDYNHWFKSCSHEITPIFTLGNEKQTPITFCGATKETVQPWKLLSDDLVLNVSGYSLSTTSELFKGPIEFASLKALLPIVHVKEIMLGWLDGSSFPATVEFWQRFYDICQEQGYKRVIACCLGGHGRTGTALAAILIANGAMTDLEAIAFIQKQYCSEAIETKSQELYLEKLYFELCPEEQAARQATLTIPKANDKIVIDMTTDMVVKDNGEVIQRSNLEAYENRTCAWCAAPFVADKNNPDDLSCSEECTHSMEEFTGYNLCEVKNGPTTQDVS